MKQRKKLLSIFAILFGIMMVLAACGTKDGAKTSGASGDKGDKITELVGGTSATFAPFIYLDNTQKLSGIDVDVLNAIGDEMGVKIKLNNVGWEPIFQQTTNGEVDFGTGGITITDERKQSYDFTDPYYEATLFIVVKEGSTIKSLQDLKDKKIAVQINSTGHVAAQKLQGKASPNIMAYEDQPIAYKEVINGTADAAIADNAVITEYLKNNPDAKLKTIEDPAFAKEYYGFMVKKGNKEVFDILNEGLKKIKENGKLAKITSQELK